MCESKGAAEKKFYTLRTNWQRLQIFENASQQHHAERIYPRLRPEKLFAYSSHASGEIAFYEIFPVCRKEQTTTY
jgi:hypothetical protein